MTQVIQPLHNPFSRSLFIYTPANITAGFKQRIMGSQFKECMGGYDFDHIAFYARRRFIDGCNTVDLMQAAGTQREKEEIALVSLLHVKNAEIQQIQLSCKHAGKCKIMDCRDRLIHKIETKIGLFPH